MGASAVSWRLAKNAKWGGKFGAATIEKNTVVHVLLFSSLFSPRAGLQRRSHLKLLREFFEFHLKLRPSCLVKRHKSLFWLPAVASGPDCQLLLHSAAPPVGSITTLSLWTPRPVLATGRFCSHGCLCCCRLAVVQIVAVGWNSYLTWKANKMWAEIRRQRRQLVCNDSAPLSGPTWRKRTKKETVAWVIHRPGENSSNCEWRISHMENKTSCFFLFCFS